MAKFFQFYHGEIGYGTTKRGPRLGVLFVDPKGRRLERMTRFTKPDADFHEEAKRIIDTTYSTSRRNITGWDDAMNELAQTATDLSPRTIDGYRKVVDASRRTLDPCPESPSDITTDHATRFCRLYASGTFTRGKAEGSIQWRRKPTALKSYIGQLQAVWHHLKALAIVTANPWREVRRPQVERKVKAVPTEEEVCAFFWWIQKRYPNWKRLHALLDLKALSGCRTNDIAQLRSEQLRGGCVVWEASQMKQRQGRTVRLPAEFFKVLQEVAGPVYLWEGIIQDLHEYRPSRQIPATFMPSTVRHLIGNLFKEYRKRHPGLRDFSPHALRRGALTLVTAEVQSLDVAAEAFGVSTQVIRKAYVDRQRALRTDEVFERTSSILIPPKLSPSDNVKTNEKP